MPARNLTLNSVALMLVCASLTAPVQLRPTANEETPQANGVIRQTTLPLPVDRLHDQPELQVKHWQDGHAPREQDCLPEAIGTALVSLQDAIESHLHVTLSRQITTRRDRNSLLMV